MKEMHEKLKEALDEMRETGTMIYTLPFEDIAQLYQILCMMRQIKNIAEWVG